MLPALLLLASIILFRAAPWLAGQGAVEMWANFSPLMAFALCGGAFLPRGWRFVLPLGAVLISHIAVARLSGYNWLHPFLYVLIACLAVNALAGWKLSRQARLPVLMAASAVGSLLFYVASNTVAFVYYPDYPATLGGWVQSLTTGLPGFPPTILFGMRQLMGDLAFTMLFAWVMKAAVVKSAVAVKAVSVPSAAPQSRHAG